MPTIDLTEEQAESLRDVLQLEIDSTDDEMKTYSKDDADYISYRHHRDTLSDILHLLEIA